MNDNKEKVVKFPMNSHEKFMKDKKCDYKTLAIMTLLLPVLTKYLNISSSIVTYLLHLSPLE